LIGVFEDAPSAGAYATYKMKGVYPGVFYNYSLCASAGSTAPMTDQGLYNWNQSAATENFVIRRDPDIAGSQVRCSHSLLHLANQYYHQHRL